jgi:hypothetical protein
LLFLLLLPFVFYVVNESRLEEVFPLVLRINTTGFLDVLLVLYLLEEPKIDVAIGSSWTVLFFRRLRTLVFTTLCALHTRSTSADWVDITRRRRAI